MKREKCFVCQKCINVKASQLSSCIAYTRSLFLFQGGYRWTISVAVEDFLTLSILQQPLNQFSESTKLKMIPFLYLHNVQCKYKCYFRKQLDIVKKFIFLLVIVCQSQQVKWWVGNSLKFKIQIILSKVYIQIESKKFTIVKIPICYVY